MQDILQDIVSHTHKLGFITTLKINAEADTTIESMADDRSVIFKAVTHTPVGEFVGTFGMPDLGKLSYHLGNPEYKDAANIAVNGWKKEVLPMVEIKKSLISRFFGLIFN